MDSLQQRLLPPPPRESPVRPLQTHASFALQGLFASAAFSELAAGSAVSEELDSKLKNPERRRLKKRDSRKDCRRECSEGRLAFREVFRDGAFSEFLQTKNEESGGQVSGDVSSAASFIPNAPSASSAGTFILHLEPGRGSFLQELLSDRQRQVAAEFGPDRTHCYFPHCSLTGFFDCADIRSVKALLQRLVRQISQQGALGPSRGKTEEPTQRFGFCKSNAFEATEKNASRRDFVGGLKEEPRVIATEDGYVVLPLRCRGVHAFVRPLQELLERQSVHLRVKRADHVTLAESRWDRRQREAIAEAYNRTLAAEGGAACWSGPWDLVLYQLERRSAGFDIEGPHSFTEHVRFQGLATHMVSFPWQTAP